VCGSYSTWPKFIETPTFKNVKRIQNASLGDIEPVDIPQAKKEPVCKVRIQIQKKGDLRFISHLDWLRMMYRAVSRSKLPVAYSQGFNPKPKIAFGPALPLFTESHGEYIDIELTERMEGVKDRLNAYLPPEGQVLDERLIPIGTPSIDKSIRRLHYRANYSVSTTCADPQNQVNMTERIAFLKSQPTLPIEVDIVRKSGNRKQPSKKVLDLVPYLENLEADGNGSISFTLRRLPARRNTAAQGIAQVEPGRYDNESQTSIQQADSAASGSAVGDDSHGLISIKPAWVLDLIHPNLNWSLIRTGIDLDAKSGVQQGAHTAS
jgi:radical SAM-linked protein